MTFARTWLRPIHRLTALFFVLVPVAAHAVEGGGTVKGTLVLVDAVRRSPAPLRNRGFVNRAPNPLKAPKAFDPLPYVVVVLEGGSVAEADKNPPREPILWPFLGESFASPLLAVQVGSNIEIKNMSRSSVRFFSPDAPDFDEDVLDSKASRTFKNFTTLQKAVSVRGKDANHIAGVVVGFPHRYFAKPDAAGNFEIKGVPAGSWKVRVWYDQGYLERVADSVIVAAGKDSASIRLTMPADLTRTELAPLPLPSAPIAPQANPEAAAPAAQP